MVVETVLAGENRVMWKVLLKRCENPSVRLVWLSEAIQIGC